MKVLSEYLNKIHRRERVRYTAVPQRVGILLKGDAQRVTENHL